MLARHGVDQTILRGLRYPRDVHRGGVLSRLLSCLVVDVLIARLSGGGIYIFKVRQMTFVF